LLEGSRRRAMKARQVLYYTLDKRRSYGMQRTIFTEIGMQTKPLGVILTARQAGASIFKRDQAGQALPSDP